ncbi:hypothetical protein VNI00_002676 [Paramarasmius palmivorus]|uniref:Uncharacterized protein n=1 Tax=Paramarasmius palmivorus TaxID=297713 RepID=A0AAW0DWZ6_9AGAR
MPSLYASLCFLLVVFNIFMTVASAPLTKRDVYVPPLIQPSSGTVWCIGQNYNVTWDTSNPPAQITNKQGSIVLGKDSRLLLDHYLAKGFDILSGSTEVTCPDVAPGTYTLVCK